MKRKVIGVSAVCVSLLAAGTLSLRADQVPLSQVPNAVQKAIQQHSQGETLAHVDQQTRDGRVVYEAEFKREGLNRKVLFAADGTMVPKADLGTRVEGWFDRKPSMALTDLPAAVQKTVKDQSAGRTVQDIDRETWNGQTIYEVEFKEPGPNSRIHVAADGSLVMNKDRAPGTYVGTQLSEAPAAVQATVKNTAGAAAVIEDVDRETRNGQVVYDVEIKQEGLNRHLTIAESGALLEDSNNNTGIRERVRERVDSDRDLRGGTVAFEQLPIAVQNTLKQQGEVSKLKPIKREMNNGRVQYDVEFEQEGLNKRLTIGEDGMILKGNR